MPLILHTRVVSGAGGGPEKTIINSPRFLADDGYPMVCAYMRTPGDPGFATLEERAREKNARLVPIDDRGALDPGILRQFKALCQEVRPAIWHAHDYKSDVIGPLMRRHVPMRLVTTLHGWGDHTWRTRIYFHVDRFVLRFYEHIICVSEKLRSEMLDLGMPESRCTHIPNAIDTEDFSRRMARHQAREALGFDPAPLVVGAVGRLSEEKGFEHLIRAFDAAVRESGANAELWIIGDGHLGDELSALAHALGCADRVRFLGFRTDTMALFQAMDIYALSSLREGLPNVVLEAMALEVPVVATRVGELENMIDDDESGLLVRPADVEGLTAGITRLLREPDTRARLAANARKTVVQRYSFATRMRRVKIIYDQVLDRGAPA